MDSERFQALGYRLDESDPDILVLRRRDGTFVAAFSAMGATEEGIRQAAEEDFSAIANEHVRRGCREGRAQRQGPIGQGHKGA